MLGPSTPLSWPWSVLGRPRLCYSEIYQTTLGTEGRCSVPGAWDPAGFNLGSFASTNAHFHGFQSLKGWKGSCSFRICLFLASKLVWQKSKGANVRNTEKGEIKAAMRLGQGFNYTMRQRVCMVPHVHVCVYMCACVYMCVRGM